MDIVFVKDLRIDTVIGIYDWERTIRQVISIDLEMGTDIAAAANSDNISDTLDYKAVSKRVIHFVRNSEFELVEKLAEQIARIVLTEFNTPWLRLKLGKPGAVRGSAEVGVVIERRKEDYVRTRQRAYVSIGSNVNARANIQAALKLLEKNFGPLTLSHCYQNPAVGFAGEDFINLVAGFDSALGVQGTASKLRDIEAQLGRDRSRPKFSARTIDLDLLILDNCAATQAGIRLPRDEILQYAFVLCPLAELVGELKHPEEQKTYAQLWAEFSGDKDCLTAVSLSQQAPA